MQSYKGSCHCGRVTFEMKVDLDHVVQCNCSICNQAGTLWHAATDDNLQITSGEADLVLYQFNTKTAKHYFCGHCGIHPFSRPRLDPSRWAANVRCLEGVDASSLPVRNFDGRNWEAAAQAVRDRMKKRVST